MKSVVLIDDQIEITQLLERFLKRYTGIRVRSFNNSQYALNHLRNHDVDLVITDIIMPGIDGIELLRQLKQFKPITKVIMMTSQASLDRVLKSHKYDAHDFLIKPIDLLELDKLIMQQDNHP